MPTRWLARVNGGTMFAPGWIEQGIPVAASGQPAPPVGVPASAPAEATLDSVGGTKQQHISARSKHPGGVNASRCDGSVSFYTDSIDLFVWNSLTSAAGNEVVSTVP